MALLNLADINSGSRPQNVWAPPKEPLPAPVEKESPKYLWTSIVRTILDPSMMKASLTAIRWTQMKRRPQSGVSAAASTGLPRFTHNSESGGEKTLLFLGRMSQNFERSIL